MKKLILAATIVCVATFANAAAVGWTCTCGTTWKSGDYSVFVVGINGFTGIDQIKTLIAGGGLDAASSYAFYTDDIATNGAATLSNADSGKSLAWTGGTTTYDAIIVVQNADGNEASYTGKKSISLTNDTTSKTFQFGNQGTTLTNNKFTVVPEPTTGLLMLFGLGALALKRRRA